jgi:hypothetical protein
VMITSVLPHDGIAVTAAAQYGMKVQGTVLHSRHYTDTGHKVLAPLKQLPCIMHPSVTAHDHAQ